jgi:hypothetical protein
VREDRGRALGPGGQSLHRHDGGEIIRRGSGGVRSIVEPEPNANEGRRYEGREGVLVCAHFMNATSTGSARTSAGRNGRAKDRPLSVRTRDNAT